MVFFERAARQASYVVITRGGGDTRQEMPVMRVWAKSVRLQRRWGRKNAKFCSKSSALVPSMSIRRTKCLIFFERSCVTFLQAPEMSCECSACVESAGKQKKLLYNRCGGLSPISTVTVTARSVNGWGANHGVWWGCRDPVAAGHTQCCSLSLFTLCCGVNCSYPANSPVC